MMINLPNLEIYYPKSIQYVEYLTHIFSGEAASNQPLAIVCPKTHDELVEFVRYAAQYKLKFSVCGGGLSSLATQNNTVCVALNKYYNKVNLVKEHDQYLVSVQGGATVGAILAQLDSVGRHIPIGVFPLAGLGLIMRGGIGYLTRSEGLTLDHIVQIKFIAASGQEFIVDANDGNQELWNALRGAAPRFGIVSEVVLKSVAGNQVAGGTVTMPLENLATWLNQVQELPNNISASLILGSQSQLRKAPVLFGFVVNKDPQGLDEIKRFVVNVNKEKVTNWHYDPQTFNYSQLPNFNVPQIEQYDSMGSVKPFVKSYLVKNDQLLKLSGYLINAILQAPNQFCCIYLQHMGGVMTTIKNGAVFSGRNADWSLVICGFSDSSIPLNEMNSAVIWVKNILAEVKSAVCGVYCVDIKNDCPETEQELQLAFKDNLANLRKLVKIYDPYQLLIHYPL